MQRAAPDQVAAERTVAPLRSGQSEGVAGARAGTTAIPTAGASRVLGGVQFPGVRFSGCHRVTAGPVCEVEPGTTLYIWQRAPFTGSEWVWTHQRLSAQGEVVAGGYQSKLSVPADTKLLQLVRDGEVQFELALTRSPSRLRLEEATDAKDRGDYEAAERLLADLLHSNDSIERWLAQGTLARIQLRRGEIESATRLLGESSEALLEAGQLSDAVRDAFALFFLYLHRQFRVRQAEQLLERWAPRLEAYPLGRALFVDHQAMLAAAVGRGVEALARYSAAEQEYLRMGQSSLARHAQDERLRILGELGQVEEAYERLRPLLDSQQEGDVCSASHLGTLAASLLLQRVEAGAVGLEQELERTLAQAAESEQRCNDPHELVLGLVNQGLWALRRGDAQTMRRLSVEVQRHPLPGAPYEAAWVLELQGLHALTERRLTLARQRFESELHLGEASGQLDPRLRGYLGLSEVERARGHHEMADRYLEAAIEQLRTAMQLAPVGSLTHTQFAARQRAARRLVKHLLERDRVQPAYELAVSAYREPFAYAAPEAASGEQRERWLERLGEYSRRREALDAATADDWKLTTTQLAVERQRRAEERRALERLLVQAVGALPRTSSSQLPEPRSGELWLLFHPAEEGWVVFARDFHGTQAVSFPVQPSLPETHHERTHAFLAPFRDRLESAARVVVLAGGASKHWPMEHWRSSGVPLARRNLAFSSALGASPWARLEGSPTRTAVVADPVGDLPGSEREGRMVQELLQVSPERSLYGQSATASAVLSLLEQSDHFHYAGHARTLPGNSGLVLAGEEMLATWELLGLGSAPRQAVLSACTAGASEVHSIGAGWGVAQLLLARGAHFVLAPVREIHDEQALEVQRRIYAQLAHGSSLSTAFWQVERDLLDAEGAAGSSGLRLFVR